MTTTVVSPAGAGDLVAGVDLLRPAVAAYLARFKGVSRSHTESDLRCFLIWCVARELDPLAAKRTHIELYVQWMQEIRRFQPSTVSRRLSVVCGFYRTCVLDTVMRTRRPSTSGARPYPPTHRPWDWGICSSRPSCPPLVSHRTGTTSPSSRCLACWACGSSRPPQRTSPTWGRSTATACCACTARATRPCWSRCHRRSAGHWTKPSAHGPPGRSCSTGAACAWTGMLPPAACATSRPRPGVRLARMHPHMLRHTFVTTMLRSGPVSCGIPV